MGAKNQVELTLARGHADTDEIQAVVDQTLAALGRGDEELVRAVERAGLRPDELSNVCVAIREEAQGADPITTGMIVAVAGGIAKDAAVALWKRVLLPRIQRRLGADAVGEDTEP